MTKDEVRAEASTGTSCASASASSSAGGRRPFVTTKAVTGFSGALHDKMDTMVVDGSELIIGLAGESGSPPGIQTFDMSTGQFTDGRLIGGLPSSVINGFGETSNILYIATDGGVGRWNYTENDWMDALTTGNGARPTGIRASSTTSPLSSPEPMTWIITPTDGSPLNMAQKVVFLPR